MAGTVARRFCTRCGSALEAGERFCAGCGAARYQETGDASVGHQAAQPNVSAQRSRRTSASALKPTAIAVALGLVAAVVVALVTEFLGSGGSFFASSGLPVSNKSASQSADLGQARGFWPGSLLARAWSRLGGSGPGVQPQFGGVAGLGTMLTLSQGGYVSKRLLGCWHGITAPQPSEWRVLSPSGLLEAYHQDYIDICLRWENQQLKLTDERYACAGCSYSPGRRFSYKVVSATGDEVVVAQSELVPMSAESGQARFKLNPDDTVDEQIESTDDFLGQPAIYLRTTARLRRKPG